MKSFPSNHLNIFTISTALAVIALMISCAGGSETVIDGTNPSSSSLTSLDNSQNPNLGAANGPAYNPGNEGFSEGNTVKMVVGILPPEGKEPFGCFADSEEATKPTLTVQFGESEVGPWVHPARYRVETCVVTMVSYFCKMEGGAEKTFLRLSAEYAFEGSTYTSAPTVALCPKKASMQLENPLLIPKVAPPNATSTTLPNPVDPVSLPGLQADPAGSIRIIPPGE